MTKPLILTLAMTAFVALSAATTEAQEFAADSTLRGEQLFPYDDQDPWKHGWIQVMPFYGGYHSFRPYNYKHVYAQSAQAQQWGIAAQAPYSQQFWHRYERRTDLSLADSVSEAAPAGQIVAPAGYLPAPVPAMQPQPAPQQSVQQQPTLPAAQPYAAPVQGYQPSPQYSGQVWGHPVGR